MSTIRAYRLREEHKSMQLFNSKVVTWEAINSSGGTPDRYNIHYDLKSIVDFNTNYQPIYQRGFTVEVSFPHNFPRSKPSARFINKQIIHPNVWTDGRLCIEDRWIPGQGISLDKICQIIGKLIAYQDYNLLSPANTDPKLLQWVRDNVNLLPTDTSEIRGPDKSLIQFGSEDTPQNTGSRITFG